MTDRPPPTNVRAEQALLSCLLQDPQLLESCDVPLDAMSHPLHRAVLADMRQHSADVMAICGRMPDHEEYIFQLLNMQPTTARFHDHLADVRSAHTARESIHAMTEAIEQLYSTEQTAADSLDQLATRLDRIAAGTDRTELVPIRVTMATVLDYIAGLAKRDRAATGVSTGYRNLDHYLTGLRPGKVYVLAARTSIGKTTLAANIARNVADSGPVAVFSLEMDQQALGVRLLCSEAGLSLADVRDGRLTASEWAVNMPEAVDRLRPLPIHVSDAAKLTAPAIRRICQRVGDLRLVVIDYLQLLTPATRSHSREQEVSEQSRAIKALAKDLAVPVILIAQLNRKAEESGGRPKLAHLRESGSIEQDADVVILLHRDDDTGPARKTEAIIAKNRGGETGVARLLFRPLVNRYEDDTAVDDADVPGKDWGKI